VVNLADQDRERYLRVAINLELKEEAIAKDVEKRLPQIMDSILMILPTKKVQDIQSSTGKIALRDEILTKLNNIFKSDVIKNIYFTEFVVQ
jgi:flagellar FliL protein